MWPFLLSAETDFENIEPLKRYISQTDRRTDILVIRIRGFHPLIKDWLTLTDPTDSERPSWHDLNGGTGNRPNPSTNITIPFHCIKTWLLGTRTHFTLLACSINQTDIYRQLCEMKFLSNMQYYTFLQKNHYYYWLQLLLLLLTSSLAE
jgi:hypothetical protein